MHFAYLPEKDVLIPISRSTRNKFTKVSNYASVLLRYGAITRHPLVANIAPSLRMRVLSRIAFSKEHGFCYFRIPKVANSTIVVSLLNNMPGREETDSEYAKQLLQGIPSVSDMDKLHTFTFVRHPASRTLSAFLDKSRADGMRRKHLCLRGEPGTISGFRYFLDGLKDGQLLHDLHWAPQTAILPYDVAKYDFVGRYELLEADLMTCLTRLYGDEASIHNALSRRTNASGMTNQFVGKCERDLIAKLYETDFEAFYPQG